MFYVYSRGDQRHNTPALFYGAIIYVQILKKCFLFLPLLITLYDKEKQVTFAPIGIDMNFYLIRSQDSIADARQDTATWEAGYDGKMDLKVSHLLSLLTIIHCSPFSPLRHVLLDSLGRVSN